MPDESDPSLNLPNAAWHCDSCKQRIVLVKEENQVRKDGKLRRRKGRWRHEKPGPLTCARAKWRGCVYYYGPRSAKLRRKKDEAPAPTPSTG